MSSSHSLMSIDVSEYDRIEAAMTESERGRWFLDAYLRRNRTNDTGILLDAIARLETVVTGDRDNGQIDRLRGDVMDMAHAIARTKAEIAAIHAPDHDQSRLGGASAALDAIVRSTERATSDILGAAEQVQEAAWTLRESGSDAAICDELDRRATAIYTACSFQDLTAQRTARIIHTLRYLEERLGAMMAIWGDVLEPVPAAPGASSVPDVPTDLCQSDVDRYIAMEASSAEPVTATEPNVAEASEDLSVGEDIVFLEATDAVDDSTPAEASEPDEAAPHTSDVETALSVAEPEIEESEPTAMALADEEPEVVTEAPIDAVARKMAESAEPVPPLDQTDVASAFADIDALSEEERRALFS
jgi:hypothetical protein